jgi:hypothetical protein
MMMMMMMMMMMIVMMTICLHDAACVQACVLVVCVCCHVLMR